MLENVGLELIGYLSGNGNTGGAHVTEVLQEIQDAGDEQIERIEAAEENMAPVFSVSTAYSVGDYVLRDGVMYRFTADHAAGTWTGSDAVAVKAGTELTQLKQDITEIETVLETKADIDGTYDQMTAGNAEQLATDKGITEKVPYLLRASGGNGADRETDKIVGGTVAWNQLCNTSGTASGERNGVTFTNNNNGGITANGTANSVVYKSLSTCTTVIGHKYFLKGCPANGSSATYQLAVDGNVGAVEYGSGCIYQASTTTANVMAVIRINTTVSNKTFIPLLIDLTQMFGTAIADRAYALEQTTAGSGINWLKSMGFFTKDYYPYNAGSLESVKGLTAHSMVGFNQWNEEWEVGNISSTTGEPGTATTVIRSKNYCPVVGSATYYLKSPYGVYLFWYTADHAFISGGWQAANITFTVPSTARYFKIQPPVEYGTTYKGDICINLSDPAKNGTCEPYVKHSYPLDSTLTLRGTLKLDENYQVYYDGDEYAGDGTVTRRYGIVDLGTLDWHYDSGSSGYFYTEISGKASGIGNLTCVKYPTYTTTTSVADMPDKMIKGGSTNSYLYTKDSSYGTDPAAFKTAMSGVYCVYELATPTIEEADPYQNPQIVDPYGTEEYETTGIVPVGHETFYPENLRAKIEGLPADFATLIAPTESTYKATRAYSANNLFIVDNILYKATTAIANGGTITPGTNCTATTLAEIIAALS